LGLSDVFVGRQQVVLQAKLLHMLLPLQQAAADAAQPDAQQQQQQEDGTDVQQDTLSNLDPGVLLEVLRRVQGFVSGLAQARVEQQQQVLPQLQQQLQRLATAVKEEKGDSTAAGRIGSSSSSSPPGVQHSDNVTTEAAEVVIDAPQPLRLEPPTAAELLGLGNLLQLLLLERQRQHQWLIEQLDQLNGTADHALQEELQLLILKIKQGDWEMMTRGMQILSGREPLEFIQYLQQRHTHICQPTGLHEELLADEVQRTGDNLHLLLTGPSWLGLERLVQQPQQQLPFWAACADAEAVRQQISSKSNHTRANALDPKHHNVIVRYLAGKGLAPPGGWGSAPQRGWSIFSIDDEDAEQAKDRWQKTQLQVLLYRHAGLTEQQAQQMADTCVALHTRLLELEVTAAALGGRVPLEVLATLQKAAPSAANSSSSSSEVLPGVRPGSLTNQLIREIELARQAMTLYCGVLGQFGIASLLVRAALIQLPGQQANSNQPPPAAAAVPSKQQLLERLAILKQLQQLLDSALETMTDQIRHLSLKLLQQPQQEELQGLLQLQQFEAASNARQLHSLQQLLQLALKLTPPAAGVLAAALQQSCQQQWELFQQVTHFMSVARANVETWQPAAAVLNDAFGFLAVGKLIGHVQQQQQQQQQEGGDILQLYEGFVQMAVQHYSYWAAGSSSSSDVLSSGTQSTPEAPTAAAAVQYLPLQMYLLWAFDEHAAALLLDTLDSSLAQPIAAALRSGVMVHEAECNNVQQAKELCETLQQILCNQQQQPKQWQALYLQGRGQLEKLTGQLGVIAQRLRALGGVLQAWNGLLQQLLQHAYEMHSLTGLLQRRLLLNLQMTRVGGQTKQEAEAAAAAAAAAEPGASSSSSKEGGVGSSTAAQLSTATSTQQQQLLRRLSLLHATAAVLCSQSVQSGAAEIAQLAADTASEAQKADTLAGAAVVPPVPANSSISSARQQVSELLASIRDACRVADNAHSRMTQPKGPGVWLLVASAAAGLGLLASLGLWQLPADAKGCSEGAAAFYAIAIHDSSSSSKAGTAGAGIDSSSSSSSAPGLQATAQQQAALLQAYAADLSEDDGSHLVDVLEELAGRKGLSGKLAVSLHGSSSSSSWRSRLPRRRLLQLMQQHCSSSSTSSPTGAAADGAEIAQAAGGSSNSLGLNDALWALLLATKPSVAAALHCNSIPPALRSYEAFERAVLGWPPATDAAEVQQQYPQQGDSGSSNATCSCGKPGIDYAYAVADTAFREEELGSDLAAALAATGMRDLYRLGTVNRAVCGDAACVARELQQLAQNGPPAVFQQGEVVSMALTAVRRDLLRLPDEYR
jgi:hypothetical protein